MDAQPIQPRLSRRTASRIACGGTLGLAAALGFAPASFACDGKKSSLRPDEALEKLKQKNADFLADKQSTAPWYNQQRLEIARGQAPFAVLGGCSDSRVPPEVLFGVGLSELFIIRNAGNTVDTAALASIGRMVEPIILAAVKAAQPPGIKDDDLLDAAVRENVRRVVERLRNSEPLPIDPLKAGKLKVVGARYDLDHAAVESFA